MLKQIEDILIVEVPEEYNGYQRVMKYPSRDPDYHALMFELGFPRGDRLINIGFDFELIGLSHLLTSEQKERIVASHILGNNSQNIMKVVWFNFITNMPDLKYTSSDSYQSWLEANEIEKNCVILKKII